MAFNPLKSQSKAADQATLESNYKGSLPSQKYFTPHEMDKLNRVGKQPLFVRPPSAKKPLPKPQNSNELSQSGTSFHHE